MTSQRPAHILMTADPVGGVWQYAMELGRGLAAAGLRVSLAVTGGTPDDAQRRRWSAIPGASLHEAPFRLEWMTEPWADVRAAGRWLLDLERRLQPDLIHLNGYAHAALPWRHPVLIVAHSCVCSWWEAVHGSAAPAEYERYRHAVRSGLRAAARVVAPSASMLAALRRQYGAPASGLVIRNGRSAPAAGPSRREALILAAGRLWDRAKNLRALAEVAPRLPWPIAVAGDTRSPDGECCDTAGMLCLGRLDEASLHRWMARASIYAHPARYEPFGLAVAEAARAGCALVLGDIDSLRELWDGAADFVDPEDGEQLMHALVRLSGDDAHRQRRAAAARERALAYDADRMTRAYLNLYAGMTADARVRRAG